MSEFIDKVRHVWRGTVHIGDIEFNKPDDGLLVQSGVMENRTEYLKKYTLLLTYAQSGRCSEKKIDMRELEDNFIRGAKEELFGQLRNIERQLVVGLYERDSEKMKSALRDLHTEIY